MQQREPFVDPQTLAPDTIEAERGCAHDQQEAGENENRSRPP
jgi:hypothetical protein